MARSRKISLGFQVVDTKSGVALSEVFKRREPARVIAKILYEQGISTGVRHLEDYISEEEYKSIQLAKKSK
jgi:hypothetical protein